MKTPFRGQWMQCYWLYIIDTCNTFSKFYHLYLFYFLFHSQKLMSIKINMDLFESEKELFCYSFVNKVEGIDFQMAILIYHIHVNTCTFMNKTWYKNTYNMPWKVDVLFLARHHKIILSAKNVQRIWCSWN